MKEDVPMLIRYAPWSLHRDLWNEVSRSVATAAWSPRVDVEEHKDKFVLYVDVPGVDPASIEVTLDDGVLTLAGVREARAEPKDLESRRSERATGRFERRFTLPDTADAENVSATGKLGVLEVVIPKRALAQARKIAVQH
jgi:HSP20 family protein